MTQHDPLVRIAHMRDYAMEAIALLGDRSLDQLQQDRTLQLALTRTVEVVGEAASWLPVAFRDRYPNVPWRKIMAMRNMLIHGYDVVECEILWTTVKQNLPPLLNQLEHILNSTDSSS